MNDGLIDRHTDTPYLKVCSWSLSLLAVAGSWCSCDCWLPAGSGLSLAADGTIGGEGHSIMVEVTTVHADLPTPTPLENNRLG